MVQRNLRILILLLAALVLAFSAFSQFCGIDCQIHRFGLIATYPHVNLFFRNSGPPRTRLTFTGQLPYWRFASHLRLPAYSPHHFYQIYIPWWLVDLAAFLGAALTLALTKPPRVSGFPVHPAKAP
jgi:hypothetical protein